MNPHVKLLALGAIAAVSIHATSPEILGGHEGWLDRMGGGIRELGMGNTGTANEEAMPAAYWNPAILPFNRKLTAGLGADMRSLQRNGGFLGVQGRLAANLGFGVGLLNRGDYDVPVYDENEKPLEGYKVARPQALGSYLGMGLKTSRNNAIGAAVQWYSFSTGLDGTGDVNVIGIFNLGWFKRWGNDLKTAVVVRNLGMNADLSADFDQTSLSGGGDAQGFERTASDFIPKTLVAAVFYTSHAFGKTVDLAVEAIDYQLKRDLYVSDANFHVQALRLGADWHLTERINLRLGQDQGNLTAGFGYEMPWGKRRILFDYAFTAERGLLTLNPFAVGFRTAL